MIVDEHTDFWGWFWYWKSDTSTILTSTYQSQYRWMRMREKNATNSHRGESDPCNYHQYSVTNMPRDPRKIRSTTVFGAGANIPRKYSEVDCVTRATWLILGTLCTVRPVLCGNHSLTPVQWCHTRKIIAAWVVFVNMCHLKKIKRDCYASRRLQTQ